MDRFKTIAAPALCTLSGLFAFGTAAAAEPIDVAGVRYEAAADVAGSQLVLNGAGLRKIVFFKVYAAGLYLPQPAASLAEAAAQDGPRRVRLTLLRNVSGSDFIEALDDGLKANLTPEGEAAIQKELTQLKAIMTEIGDVKEGDVVDFDFSPEAGTTVTRNGAPVGEAIPGKPLYDAVLAIWLGEKPIDGSLKKGLLGQK